MIELTEIIAICIAVIVVAITAIVITKSKGSVKIKAGKNEIVFAGSGCGVVIADKPWRVQKLIAELQRMLPTIYDSMKICILTHAKNYVGVPEETLSSNGDYDIINVLLRHFTKSRNGEDSIRTILEDRILAREFEVHELTDRAENNRARQMVMRSVIPQIQSAMSIVFERDYPSTITIFDKETKTTTRFERLINQEHLLSMLRDHINEEISPIIETLFDIQSNFTIPKGEK